MEMLYMKITSKKNAELAVGRLIPDRTAERRNQFQIQADGGALGEGSSRRGKVISAEPALKMTGIEDWIRAGSDDSGQSAVSIPAQTGQKSSTVEIPDPDKTGNASAPLCGRACFRFSTASPAQPAEQPQLWLGRCRKKLPTSSRSRKIALIFLIFFRMAR